MLRTLYILIVALSFLSVNGHATEKSSPTSLIPHEMTPQWIREEPIAPPLKVELAPFYDEFKADKNVYIFLGLGADFNGMQALAAAHTKLVEINKTENLGLSAIYADEARQVLSFADSHGVKYIAQFSRDRNAFMKAFSNYEVVMYFGHSRYGRGPAFETYQGYFRMGKLFETIEVDTRSPLFKKEPILLQETYPLQYITLGSEKLPYQYVGQKVESSYLPTDSYTKNIPGLDVDLKKAKYKPGRQLWYLLSCSNQQHFSKPIRARHPNPKEKLVLGTTYDVGTSVDYTMQEVALFLSGIAAEVADSKLMVDRLPQIDTAY